jgi:hypothetical protein
MSKREDRIIDAVKRMERTACTTRLRKTITESVAILETKEQSDVLSFVVYESWLVFRSRKILRDDPCPTFDSFLTEFLVFSFLGSVENE